MSGLAGKFGETLKEAGFTVIAPTTYNGTSTTHTRIQVKEAGLGLDLVPFFKDVEVEVDPEAVGTIKDMRIILGTSEQE